MPELTDAVCEVVESMGVRLPVDPQIMSEVMCQTIRSGRYEKSEAKNLPSVVEPGERVLELGAGIGFLSAVIAGLGRAEAIVAVEANPELIPLIHKTHALNGVRAAVIHAAVVADDAGKTVSFPIAEDFWSSSLAPRKGVEMRDVVEVPAISLRRLIEAHRPTLLIVDVEGSELELFSRPEDLEGVRAVLMEVHQKIIRPAGVKRLFDFLSAAGFYVDVRQLSPEVVLFRRL